MQTCNKTILVAGSCLILMALILCRTLPAEVATENIASAQVPERARGVDGDAYPTSIDYRQVQRRLASGWNTWDVDSVATQVLLPEALAIHVGLKHSSTHYGEEFLRDALIGRLTPDAEQVTPGPHSWDGSYTDLHLSWKGHSWRIQSAHQGSDLVLLITPLSTTPDVELPPIAIFSVNFLWNRPGTALKRPSFIETQGASGTVNVYCTCEPEEAELKERVIDFPAGGPYFATDLDQPVGLSTGKRRTLAEIEAAIAHQRDAYEQVIVAAGKSGPLVDAIETTLSWDSIYEPSKQRVISPVSRLWSVSYGGYVIFDWDTFFAATMAGIGDRDLAYADTIETLREATKEGFVANYVRAGGWKSFDRSEPPVGAITVLGLYKKFHDRWFLEDSFVPLLRWNRWWEEHRDIQGYLTWGSDGEYEPRNPQDESRGVKAGAILESGLDNSPMYDAASYNAQSHLLEYADVGLMSMYIADCDALSQIAQIVNKPVEARELRERGARYRRKLASLWDEQIGIFLNKDLHTGTFITRLSPTNFYPMLAHAATPVQAKVMIEKHLLNRKEFWGQWVIPSIARDDPAFQDQDYWRGRIWGPMNYLVYLGLRNYDVPGVRREFAQKSYGLFLKEWDAGRHVHENYNAISGTGDDVPDSDRFYHWGALLGYVEYMEQSETAR